MNDMDVEEGKPGLWVGLIDVFIGALVLGGVAILVFGGVFWLLNFVEGLL